MTFSSENQAIYEKNPLTRYYGGSGEPSPPDLIFRKFVPLKKTFKALSDLFSQFVRPSFMTFSSQSAYRSLEQLVLCKPNQML